MFLPQRLFNLDVEHEILSQVVGYEQPNQSADLRCRDGVLLKLCKSHDL